MQIEGKMNSFSMGTEKLYSLESPIKSRIKLSTVGVFLFGVLTIAGLVISHRKVLLRHTETTTLLPPHNDTEINQDVNLTTPYPIGNGTENHFPTTVSASDDVSVKNQNDYVTTLVLLSNDTTIYQGGNLTLQRTSCNDTENHFSATISSSENVNETGQDDYITTLSPQPNDTESEYPDFSTRYDFDVRPFWGGFCFHYYPSCNELKQRNNNSEICENASVEILPIPNINWGCMCPDKKY